VAAGAAWFWLKRTPKSDPTNAKLKLAPATKPPAILPALRYLPRDTQAILAVQPSPVLQYAERTGQDPKKLFEDLGVPKKLWDGLIEAGMTPEVIDHLAIGVSAADLWVLGVLVLREPIDEDRLRQQLKAKVNPDKPGRSSVVLGGIGWDMQQADERTLLFAFGKDSILEAATKPSAGLADLRAGLKESIERLNLSSFVWLATDSTDWTQVKGLELLAAFAGQKDWPKRLDGYRALVASLSFEPEWTLSFRVRCSEPARVNELAATLSERFRETKATVTTTDAWAEMVLPFEPPKDALGVLKKALEK
jgi:hypothetical protein